MIYLDTSVALAHLLAEDRRPPDELWREDLISSRILEYEMWNRLHARELTRSHGDVARLVLARISFIELSPSALERALHPFPVAVRTLDALHLSSAFLLAEQGIDFAVATYDRRMADATQAMGMTVYAL